MTATTTFLWNLLLALVWALAVGSLTVGTLGAGAPLVQTRKFLGIRVDDADGNGSGFRVHRPALQAA